MDHDESALNWISTIFIAMMVIILMLLSISSLQQTYKAMKSLKEIKGQKVHSLLLCTTFVTILLFTLAGIFSITMGTATLITNDIYTHIAVVTAGNFTLLCYLLSQCMMLFVFTLRIEVTFRNTALKYSNRLIKALKASSTSLLIFYVFILFTLFTGNYNWTYLSGTIWAAVYLVMSITLMVLFIRPINKLMIQQTSTRLRGASSNNSNHNVTVVTKSKSTETSNEQKTESQLEASSTDKSKQETCNITKSMAESMIDADFLYVVIKHGVLVTIAIIPSFIFNTTSVLTANIFYIGGYSSVAMFWIVLDGVMSSVCTYLLCGVNKRVYGFMCYRVHSRCERMKLKTIVNKLEVVQNETSNHPVGTPDSGNL